MKLKPTPLFCLVLALGLVAIPVFSASVEPLKIEHSPVTLAVRGQNILFRTRVTPGAHPIKAVTLFYAVSRDAAPYKIAMQNSGAGWFTGSISADMTTELKQILYYIEARDVADSTSETPWYTLVVKNSGTPEVTPTAQDEKGSSWTKPALIAGGVILAGGAALALASGGGGGGGGSSDGATTNNSAGTYNGSVTRCVQPPGSSSTCSSRVMTLVIDANNTVSSDTLAEGQHLEGKLSGSNFLLVSTVAETNGTGQLQYLGTVINNRIAGSIQGTLSTPTGTGTYSGNFNAIK